MRISTLRCLCLAAVRVLPAVLPVAPEVLWAAPEVPWAGREVPEVRAHLVARHRKTNRLVTIKRASAGIHAGGGFFYAKCLISRIVCN